MIKRIYFKILLLSLLLFLPLDVYGVTEFVCTMNVAGEDYNTLGIFEDAMDNAGNLINGTVATGDWDAQSGTIADAANVTWNSGADDGTFIHMTDAGATGTYLVRGDDSGDIDNLADDDVISDGSNTITVNGTPDSAIIVLEIYNDEGTLAGAGWFNGITCDATNYVKITCPVAERHDGTEGSGVVVSDEYDAGALINIQDTFFEVSWLEIYNSGTNRGLYSDQGSGNFHHLIVRDCGSDGILGGENSVFDCIVYNCTDDGIDESRYTYNNTVYNSGDDGITSMFWRDSTAKNNVSVGNTGSDYVENAGNGWTVASNNLDEDGTAPGTASVTTTQTLDGSFFVDTTGGSEDLHLVSGADAIDAGVDLVTTPTGVQFDIDNYDRDTEAVTWDIGADEYVAAPAGAVIQPIINIF